MRFSLIIIIVIVGLLLLAASLVWLNKIPPTTTTSFEECAAAGNAIMESYPPRCRAADGQTFTQDIGNELEKMDLIRVDSPRPTTTVNNPIIISGEARGTWFFEASFPIHLEDASGTRIATAIAQAQGEWMTTEFVPFETELTIPAGFTGPATLVLEKDNPSGLPEHDDALRIPLTVSP